MSRRTHDFEVYLANEGSGLAFFSTDLGQIFCSIVGKENGMMLRGTSPHKRNFAHSFVRLHPLMVLTDLTEYRTAVNAKVQSLSCFFFSKMKARKLLITGQYMDCQRFSNLQFRPLLEKSSHSIHIDLKNTSGEKIPVVSVGITRLVLMLKKASNNHI